MDFCQHMEVASLYATEEMVAVASFPKPHRFRQPREHMPIYSSSEHLGSLPTCFLDSVAWAATVTDTHASKKA